MRVDAVFTPRLLRRFRAPTTRDDHRCRRLGIDVLLALRRPPLSGDAGRRLCASTCLRHDQVIVWAGLATSYEVRHLGERLQPALGQTPETELQLEVRHDHAKRFALPQRSP